MTGIGLENEKDFLIGDNITVSVVLEEPLDKELASVSGGLMLGLNAWKFASEVVDKLFAANNF